MFPFAAHLLYLVGGLEHFLFFHIYILGITIPTDFHIFRGVGIPPTSLDKDVKSKHFLKGALREGALQLQVGSSTIEANCRKQPFLSY